MVRSGMGRRGPEAVSLPSGHGPSRRSRSRYGVSVGFAERVRAWLRGDDARSKDAPPAGAASRSAGAENASSPARRSGRRRGRAQHPSASFDGSALLEFARSRNGVEVYLEPRTRLYGDSVLLVADDGEYLRRPIPDADAARRFCGEHGIPVYDAERTGYPRRVRDYDRGIRPDRIGLEDLPPWPGQEPDATVEEEPPPPPPAV